jgi:hypothetical protein
MEGADRFAEPILVDRHHRHTSVVNVHLRGLSLYHSVDRRIIPGVPLYSRQGSAAAPHPKSTSDWD